MSAHPSAYERLAVDISRTRDRIIQDELLDKWLEYKYLATNWDASQWGFDPENWMAAERVELMRRLIPDNTSPASRRLDRGVS